MVIILNLTTALQALRLEREGNQLNNTIIIGSPLGKVPTASTKTYSQNNC